MKTGAIISIVVATLAICGMIMAFLTNASPYVSVKEAIATPGDNLHLMGDIDKSTMKSSVAAGEIRFALKDEKGDTIDVVYSGPLPSNMGEATRVVCVGGVQKGEFRAHKLLIKCPSKYEGKQS